jgi:metal-dependent amidase/aminoacylase/carboxypeptidase family protein
MVADFCRKNGIAVTTYYRWRWAVSCLLNHSIDSPDDKASATNAQTEHGCGEPSPALDFVSVMGAEHDAVVHREKTGESYQSGNEESGHRCVHNL